MKHKKLRFGAGFRISIQSKKAQAAEMVMAPGDKEGGPDNFHRGSDQWLFVVKGSGTAVVEGKKYPLRAGVLLLIEKGDRHEIKCTGKTPLRALNVYVPPAYTAGGDPIPQGRGKRR